MRATKNEPVGAMGEPLLGPPDLRGQNKLVPTFCGLVDFRRGTLPPKKGRRELLGDLGYIYIYTYYTYKPPKKKRVREVGRPCAGGPRLEGGLVPVPLPVVPRRTPRVGLDALRRRCERRGETPHSGPLSH